MPEMKQFDFAYTFQPVYYFSRVFGFMPFTIEYDTNGKIHGPKLRLIDILWFILAIFLYILSIIVHFRNVEQYSKDSSFILIYGDYLILKLNLIFIILIVVLDMCNRFKLIDILKNINTFDEKVSD